MANQLGFLSPIVQQNIGEQLATPEQQQGEFNAQPSAAPSLHFVPESSVPPNVWPVGLKEYLAKKTGKSIAEITAAARELANNVKANPAIMGRPVDDLFAIAKNREGEASEAIRALGTMIETREGAYFPAVSHLLELSKMPQTADLALSEMKRLLQLPLGETAKSWDTLSSFQARQNLIDAAYRHPTKAKELLEAAKECPNGEVVAEATRKLELLGYK